MPKQTIHVNEMDGLRGILSSWVVLAHILCWSGFVEAAWRFPQTLVNGWYTFIYATEAVETFMILSGFAISFLVQQHSESYFKFILNRVFRIYPVYLVCLAVGILTTSLTPYIINTSSWQDTSYFVALRSIAESEYFQPVEHVLLHLSLLNGLIPKDVLSNTTATFLPPAWSITLEWQYYLVAPLVAFMVFSGTRLMLLMAVAYVGNEIGHLYVNLHLAFLPAQLPLFLIGIGSYHFYNIILKDRVKTSNMRSVFFVMVIGLAALTSWHWIAITIWALALGSVLSNGNDLFGKFLLLVRKILLSKPFQYLGKISYPLYLVHWPIIVMLLSLTLYYKPNISQIQAASLLLGIGFPLMIFASHALHVSVEKPMMRFGKKAAARLATSDEMGIEKK